MADDDGQWLTTDQTAAWMPLLAVVTWLPSALDIQLEQDAGISNYEYGVLAALSLAPAHTTRLKDLARDCNSTLPRLSKVLDRMTTLGWVCRRPDPEDGRSTLAHLTAAGWDMVQTTAPGHVARVRELVFSRLTRSQIRQLTTIASTIAAAVGPDAACASRFK